ncbi:MAG: hypothetical protein K2N28_06950 [Muribaculaceae bacterium]|nr:hypothetical protein [Muribaculaceae bacterium]
MENAKDILDAACRAWSGWASVRTRRDKYKRFTYGDQWSYMVSDGDRYMTAAERAVAHGRRPMTNNMLRRLVKSVIGRYRYRRQDGEQLTGEAARVYAFNNLDEIDCRSLEEFLISGCTIQRVIRERRLMGHELWVDMVCPDRFFVNPIRDPRGWDAELVGMLHDWSLTETVIRLAGDDPGRAAAIRQIYGSMCSNPVLGDWCAGSDHIDSFLSAPPGRCRVIEVWTLEAVTRRRPRRKTAGAGATACDVSTMWRCRWLAPDGTVLASHVSRSPDGMHPFKFRFYPMIDGEVHSLVEDVIDQQIYINELISLIDHVVSCAAKGVLVFPVEEMAPGMTLEKVTEKWSSPDAVIPIRRGISKPEQITASGGSLAAKELLEIQMQMFEDVSGVTNVLMGRTASGRIGVEQYESQVRNALIAIADILDTFGNFIAARNSALV